MERKRPDGIEQVPAPRRPPSGAAVRRPSVTEALQRALFREWSVTGYGALSLEAVAARAGVGKASLYRRWKSKGAMVADCLGAVGLEITEVPDTGSLEGDLRALLRSFRRVLRHPLARRIVPDIHAEMTRSSTLEASIRHLQADRRARGAVILGRAIDRGELDASADIELASDLIAAPIYWRMIVTAGRADRAYLDRLTRALLAALKAS